MHTLARTSTWINNRVQEAATSFATLQLSLAKHMRHLPESYLDHYWGDREVLRRAVRQRLSLPEIKDEARFHLPVLERLLEELPDGLTKLRVMFLIEQLQAVTTCADVAQGRKPSFQAWHEGLYGIEAPVYGEDQFTETLERIRDALGAPDVSTAVRLVTKARTSVRIPSGRIAVVNEMAFTFARQVTARHLNIPNEIQHHLELTKDRSWSAYHTYLGGYLAKFRINTSGCFMITQPASYAAHEGYPGHHLHISTLDRRGWPELTVMSAWQPLTMVMDGLANLAPHMIFPSYEDRRTFERELGIAAGIDTEATEVLHIARPILLEARAEDRSMAVHTRALIDGQMTEEDIAARHTLWSALPASWGRGFVERCKAYGPIMGAYAQGVDLVDAWLNRRGGNTNNMPLRWKLYGQLLGLPMAVQALLPEHDHLVDAAIAELTQEE